MDEMEPIQELHELECWERLRQQTFGRLAYHLLDEVHIVPLNYFVEGQQLLFRTAEGGKLLGVAMNGDVALEIDEVGEDSAWSVIARGTARTLDEGEVDKLEDRLPPSWVDYPKYDVVAVEVTEVTGRRFSLANHRRAG